MIISFIKKDYQSVRMAIKLLTNNKAPEWVILLWYIVLAPVGFLLAIPVWIATKIYIWKLMRDLKKELDEIE